MVVVGGAGGFLIGKGSSAADTDSAAATSSATTSATPTVYDIPITPDDFRMNIEVLEKKCFGSAGCVVEFSVRPTLLTSSKYVEGRRFRVVYEILGTDDEMTELAECRGHVTTNEAFVFDNQDADAVRAGHLPSLTILDDTN